jgi:glycosyltransferase involved in cell wall biosynthesis
MVELAELSDRLVVMSEHSSQFLQDIFQVAAAKIDVIPHGVPNLAFVDPNFYKDRFGVGGQSVLLTFGLLSPNKGVESVIEAMPRILAQNSNVTYIWKNLERMETSRQRHWLRGTWLFYVCGR